MPIDNNARYILFISLTHCKACTYVLGHDTYLFKIAAFLRPQISWNRTKYPHHCKESLSYF